MSEKYLVHHGVLGMRWGVRRYQNRDGSYTQQGRLKYGIGERPYGMSRREYRSRKTIARGERLYKSGNTSPGLTLFKGGAASFGVGAAAGAAAGALTLKYGDNLASTLIASAGSTASTAVWVKGIADAYAIDKYRTITRKY